MKSKLLGAAAVLALVASAALAANEPMVGGAAMYPSKDIVDNAVNSKDHTTLVAAVKAAGLVETLKGAGPFTVFAPTNAAFNALLPGTVDTLVKPESKPALTKILTYHVVPGRLDRLELDRLVKSGFVDRGRERQGHYRHRRPGRHGHGYDRRCLPEKRRHPRRRQGTDAVDPVRWRAAGVRRAHRIASLPPAVPILNPSRQNF